MAIDALDADPGTKRIVLVSKPPDPLVAKMVLDRVAQSLKPFAICFLGARHLSLPANARAASTFKAAAELAIGAAMATSRVRPPPIRSNHGKRVRGLFAGGSLCAEAQIVFRQAGLAVASNVPAPGALPMTGANGNHLMMDLGDDEFTRGRPHPMIDPAVRDRPLGEALADPEVGVILLDVVLGFGAHPDPAGHLASVLTRGRHGSLILASITGTDRDPQPRSEQVSKLAEAGVIVADSNADAAMMALTAIGVSTR
jgi:FdrA protein